MRRDSRGSATPPDPSRPEPAPQPVPSGPIPPRPPREPPVPGKTTSRVLHRRRTLARTPGHMSSARHRGEAQGAIVDTFSEATLISASGLASRHSHRVTGATQASKISPELSAIGGFASALRATERPGFPRVIPLGSDAALQHTISALMAMRHPIILGFGLAMSLRHQDRFTKYILFLLLHSCDHAL
jgi:hypothetical protein